MTLKNPKFTPNNFNNLDHQNVRFFGGVSRGSYGFEKTGTSKPEQFVHRPDLDGIFYDKALIKMLHFSTRTPGDSTGFRLILRTSRELYILREMERRFPIS